MLASAHTCTHGIEIEFGESGVNPRLGVSSDHTKQNLVVNTLNWHYQCKNHFLKFLIPSILQPFIRHAHNRILTETTATMSDPEDLGFDPSLKKKKKKVKKLVALDDDDVDTAPAGIVRRFMMFMFAMQRAVCGWMWIHHVVGISVVENEHRLKNGGVIIYTYMCWCQYIHSTSEGSCL